MDVNKLMLNRISDRSLPLFALQCETFCYSPTLCIALNKLQTLDSALIIERKT